MAERTCPRSRRADRLHSWRFDGDDPYVICVFCDEMCDALNGRIIREGRGEPKRIQLRRTKGWRKPEGAIVVSRPSRWGNPFIVGELFPMPRGCVTKVRDRAHAVKLYRRWLFTQERSRDLVPELAGHDLACWCPLDQPCHADVLLELANA